VSHAPHPVLGIIGGMGPAATLDFMRRILERTPARDDADHIHMLVESNPRIPSRIAHLIERTGADPTAELVRVARNLEAGGATLLAMPCNTAHNYAAAIRGAVSIPLLDMVELTVGRVATLISPSATRVGLLASSAVLLTRIYDEALERQSRRVVAPAGQAKLMELIRGVKAGRAGPAEREALATVATALAAQSDCIVIACTELSLLAGALPDRVPVVDSLDVLTDAVLAATLNTED
jgi:aspartate racemase